MVCARAAGSSVQTSQSELQNGSFMLKFPENTGRAKPSANHSEETEVVLSHWLRLNYGHSHQVRSDFRRFLKD